MNIERPIFLNLTQIRFPIAAIISILHRISGVVIFLSLPLMLYVLHESLASQQSFLALRQFIAHPVIKVITLIILGAIAYHIIAGIRHLFMDLGCFESLEAGRATAVIVLVLTVAVVIALGVCLWS